MKRADHGAVRSALEPTLRRALHLYWRFARAMTLGVRALVVDGEGRIFLVRHSYVSGWHLPGGGVEAGETLTQALARELQEEGNIELTEPPRLFGLFFNDRASRRDHVALYVVRGFRQPRRRSPAARSWRTASSRRTRCPAIPPQPPAPASSRCSAARRPASDGSLLHTAPDAERRTVATHSRIA